MITGLIARVDLEQQYCLKWKAELEAKTTERSESPKDDNTTFQTPERWHLKRLKDDNIAFERWKTSELELILITSPNRTHSFGWMRLMSFDISRTHRGQNLTKHWNILSLIVNIGRWLNCLNDRTSAKLKMKFRKFKTSSWRGRQIMQMVKIEKRTLLACDINVWLLRLWLFGDVVVAIWEEASGVTEGGVRVSSNFGCQ